MKAKIFILIGVPMSGKSTWVRENSKRRRSTLKYFTDFYKEAVVFPVLSNEEYDRRNKIRTVNENKSIPLAVLRTMLNSYQSPTKEEGFDKITVLK